MPEAPPFKKTHGVLKRHPARLINDQRGAAEVKGKDKSPRQGTGMGMMFCPKVFLSTRLDLLWTSPNRDQPNYSFNEW